MIFGFSSKRREQRDRDVGLVFGWRSRDSTAWTTFLASVITIGVVVFCIYALRIPLVDGVHPRRDRGATVDLFQITDQTSSRILSLIQDGGGVARDVNHALEDIMHSLDSQTAYIPQKQTELRPLPQVLPSLNLPSFTGSLGSRLPAPSYSDRLTDKLSSPSLVPKDIVFRLEGLGLLENRVPTQNLPFLVENPASFIGQSVRVQVALSPSGAVESAWILEPQDLSHPMAEAVQKWLPRQVFLPKKTEGLIWGELVFKLRMEEPK